MPTKKTSYKIRFNPATTVDDINATLDAIDANGGYCPCQVKSDAARCRCAAFRLYTDIGKPCFCGIYVKVAKGKGAKKKG